MPYVFMYPQNNLKILWVLRVKIDIFTSETKNILLLYYDHDDIIYFTIFRG